jgi:hypothetical protein
LRRHSGQQMNPGTRRNTHKHPNRPIVPDRKVRIMHGPAKRKSRPG